MTANPQVPTKARADAVLREGLGGMSGSASQFIDVANKFVEAYYEQGDFEAAASCLDRQRVTWFGASSGVWASEWSDVERLLRARCRRSIAASFHILEHECRVAFRDCGCAVVLSRVKISRGNAHAKAFVRRISFVFAPDAWTKWRIVHVHVSAPDSSTVGNAALEEGAQSAESTISTPEEQALLERLRVERERYEIVMELTDDIIFEYDVFDDALEIFMTHLADANAHARNRYVVERFTERSDPYAYVHPDDVPCFWGHVRSLPKVAPARAGQRVTHSLDCRMRASLFGGNADIYDGEDEALSGTEAGKRHTDAVFQPRRILYRCVYDAEATLVKVVGKIVDISEEVELLQQSTTDALTGAFNRTYAQNQLADYLRTKQPDTSFACILMDVDSFKQVNDLFGHPIGDSLLNALVEYAHGLFRGSDVVARLGGDEFMVLMWDVREASVVCEKAEALGKLLGMAARSWGLPDGVSLSFGVSIQKDTASFADLHHQADVALYRAKAAGKDRVVIYEPGMTYPQ